MKILIDRREQAPFGFKGERYRGTEIAFGTLDTGDYSLAGLTDKVAVERKCGLSAKMRIWCRQVENVRCQIFVFGMKIANGGHESF